MESCNKLFQDQEDLNIEKLLGVVKRHPLKVVFVKIKDGLDEKHIYWRVDKGNFEDTNIDINLKIFQ